MKNIYVNKPFLPDLELVNKELKKIWKSKILSNNGPYHQRFEEEIARYLKVEYVSLFNNCTTALLVAIKAMELKGEVITTPFTFAASTSALIWNGIKPIFVDIEKDSFNIDYKQIENNITSNTVGILGVHSYGNPCEVSKIKEICSKHNLQLIYDGAAAFGTRRNNKTILLEGDCSVVSFHATKLLNTFEGGAVISSNKGLKNKIDKLKNFGMDENGQFKDTGINGKLSEFNSMIGCLQLERINEIIEKRKFLSNIYTKYLSKCIHIKIPSFLKSNDYNFSYYPILIKETSPKNRDQIYIELCKKSIFCKRYYNPLIPEIESIAQESPIRTLPIAEYISENIICLPLYPDLKIEEQKWVYESLIKILQVKI